MKAITNAWGIWKYDPKDRVLVGTPKDFPGCLYEIDLDRCQTSGQKCDWLAQIAEKTWASPEVLGHLVQALDEVVGLRPGAGDRE